MHKNPFLCCVDAFLSAFPNQRRFGRAAAARHLQQLMRDTGLNEAEVLLRIKRWKPWRADMKPWDLAKAPPAPMSKEAPDRPAVEIGEASNESREWLEKMNSEWEGEDV